MRHTKLLILLISSVILLPTKAQELICSVTINSDQVEGTNKSVFNTLQTSITEFVNNSKWTSMTYAEMEKIECSMMLVIKSYDPSTNMYVCEYQVQSRRPIFGTSYSSPLINFRDKNFNFTYQEFDRLEYQPNTFSSNLTAMLAYYCYLIIGYDMDSYSKLGGTPYFQECENIVSNAQSAGIEKIEEAGWKAFDSNRNRYALISNLMDEAFRKFREYFYTYHRFGLDEMVGNVTNGRSRIASEFSVLRDANRARPATYIVNTFLDAKSDEIVNIFKMGTSDEKKLIIEILDDVDPSRQSTYDEINK